MNRLPMQRLHPATIFFYYITILATTMFQMNAVICLIAFLTACISDQLLGIWIKKKEAGFYLGLFIVAALVNPLFQHNGETILFWLAGQRVTLEALVYGVVTAILILSILLWCRQLSQIFTTDQSMYLIGRISPKGALILSMILSLIPQYKKQFQTTKAVQQKLGLYGEGALSERFVGDCKVFLATVTWALEHSMETADSMRARGYGIGKRTFYTTYRFRVKDGILCLIQALLCGVVIYCQLRGIGRMYYYPQLQFHKQDIAFILYELFYGVLCMGLPVYLSLARTTSVIKKTQKGDFL